MEEPRSSSSSRQGSFALPKEIGSRKVEEVWKEIAAGGKGDGGDGSGLEMTLEDFLARNGAVREEDVRVPLGSVQGGFGLDSGVGGEFRPAPAAAAAGDGLRKGERRNGEIVKEYISEWTGILLAPKLFPELHPPTFVPTEPWSLIPSKPSPPPEIDLVLSKV